MLNDLSSENVVYAENVLPYRYIIGGSYPAVPVYVGGNELCGGKIPLFQNVHPECNVVTGGDTAVAVCIAFAALGMWIGAQIARN